MTKHNLIINEVLSDTSHYIYIYQDYFINNSENLQFMFLKYPKKLKKLSIIYYEKIIIINSTFIKK